MEVSGAGGAGGHPSLEPHTADLQRSCIEVTGELRCSQAGSAACSKAENSTECPGKRSADPLHRSEPAAQGRWQQEGVQSICRWHAGVWGRPLHCWGSALALASLLPALLSHLLSLARLHLHQEEMGILSAGLLLRKALLHVQPDFHAQYCRLKLCADLDKACALGRTCCGRSHCTLSPLCPCSGATLPPWRTWCWCLTMPRLGRWCMHWQMGRWQQPSSHGRVRGCLGQQSIQSGALAAALLSFHIPCTCDKSCAVPPGSEAGDF